MRAEAPPGDRRPPLLYGQRGHGLPSAVRIQRGAGDARPVDAGQVGRDAQPFFGHGHRAGRRLTRGGRYGGKSAGAGRELYGYLADRAYAVRHGGYRR